MLEDENDSPKETQLTTEEEKKEEEIKEEEIKIEDNKIENIEKTKIEENISEKIKENKEDIKIEKKTKIELNENDDKEEISTSKKNDLNEIKKISEIDSNKNYVNNLFIPDQTYDLLLDDNGNPNLNENSIFVIDNNSELNIKIMNNIKISNELNLISNCYKEFPNLNFEDELKQYIKIEKKNIDIINEDENELPLNKINDYIIEPDKINIMIYFKVQYYDLF